MTVVFENSTPTVQLNSTSSSLDAILDGQFAMLILLSLFGTVINLVTASALMQSPRLRSRATTFFVLNLSLADLAFSLFNGPLDSGIFYNRGWAYGRSLCVSSAAVRHVSVGCSLVSIQLITFNRYISVVKPRAYGRLFSPGSCLVLAALSWVIPAILLLPPTMGVWGNLGYDAVAWSCTVCGKGCFGFEPANYRAVLYLGAALSPVLLFTFCYPQLFLALRHSSRRLTSHCLSR